MNILQFVIPKNNQSLCLVNPEKRDIFNLYIRYSPLMDEGSNLKSYEPVMMKTDQLFEESYAILEENHQYGIGTAYIYEILYVSDEGVVIQNFYRNKLQNVHTIRTHSLFRYPIWSIEETDNEVIDPEEIISIVFKDIYAKEAPLDSSRYRTLLEKSELFEYFFEDLYFEMGRFHKGDKSYSRDKWEFAQILKSNYHVQLVQSEGSDIILSNCSGIMQKLNLSKKQMAEYFIRFLD